MCSVVLLLVCMRRECERDGNPGVGDGGGVVVANAGHVVGTRGSGIVSSAADVLECGAWDERSLWNVYVFGSGQRRRRGGEWMRGFGWGFTNPV